MVYVLSLFYLVVMAVMVAADCNLTAEDWGKIQTGLASPNFYNYFSGTGDCDVASTGLLKNKYGDCTSSLENVLDSRGFTTNCRAAVNAALYTDNGVLDSGKAIAESIDICERTLGNGLITNYLCNPTEVPGCPASLQVAKFAAVVACFGLNRTLEESQRLFADNHDKSCLTTQKFCDSFSIFQTCLVSFEEVVDAIYVINEQECSRFFYGAPDMEQRCAQSVAEMYTHYCEQSFAEKNLIALAVGVPCAVVALTVLIVCFVRIRGKGHITEQELLASMEEDPITKPKGIEHGGSFYSSSPGSITSQKEIHPELAAVMEMKSKYKGIAFDAREKRWKSVFTGQLFASEIEAAKATYLAQANSRSPRNMESKSPVLGTSPSSPTLSAMNSQSPIAAYIDEPMIKAETDEEKKQRRIKQLISFYEYWDNDREDIPGHCETLFRRHDFTHVARAVKTKFGLLPPGWEEEIQGDDSEV